MHSALDQCRSQLQKRAEALHDCLVDYEFSKPAGVLLECRTRKVAKLKQTGE